MRVRALEREAYKNEEARTALSRNPGQKPGNDLLSRDLTSYYHWLLGA